MRIHYLQHVQYEGLANIEEWAKMKGHILTCTQFFYHDTLPSVEQFDWLIIMGGPMGANDENLYPWLKLEKQFIRQSIDQGRVVLGICLGAQLIAAALGANVYSNSQKEIGWFPVTLTEEGRSSAVFNNFISEFMAFHWHGDTFDIPEGAIRLAGSKACRNQAFLYGDRVLAIQFHFDIKREGIRNLISECSDDLKDGSYVQTPEKMLKEEELLDEISGRMKAILEYFKELWATTIQ